MTRIITSNFQLPRITQGNHIEEVVKDFDPDLSPVHPVNTEADRQRGWTYHTYKRAYVDSDGCLMADEFGQRF
jgi:hypothetical protein